MILFLDTNIVIYIVEGHTKFGLPSQIRLSTARASGDTVMISDLTRMECLVGPLQAGNSVLEAAFRIFFASPGVQVVSITHLVCDRAALIRAKNRFKPMDALQLAAAVEHGADVFLTNDVRLSSFPNLTVELLP
jgi:predicted nucleic acid-binding protein